MRKRQKSYKNLRDVYKCALFVQNRKNAKSINKSEQKFCKITIEKAAPQLLYLARK